MDLREKYIAVCNDEGQYSLWMAGKKIPVGWRQVAEPMSKDDCLKHIESNWTDMRPVSRRGNSIEECRY